MRGLLDAETLEALLTDVGALCEIEAITFKAAAEAHADAAVAKIDSVQPALASGTAVRSHSYRGERWCDTLLPGMTETLLVRIREPKLPR